MPCINTHMAVVVFGLLARSATWKPQYFEFKWWWWEPLVWTTAFILVALIAFSRLVAGSRFVYQVVLSVFTGIKGVAIAAAIILPMVLALFGSGHFYARSFLRGFTLLAGAWTLIVLGLGGRPSFLLGLPLIVLADALGACAVIGARAAPNQRC